MGQLSGMQKPKIKVKTCIKKTFGSCIVRIKSKWPGLIEKVHLHANFIRQRFSALSYSVKTLIFRIFIALRNLIIKRIVLELGMVCNIFVSFLGYLGI